jgi:MYXO-CTERM domain-containing protein
VPVSQAVQQQAAGRPAFAVAGAAVFALAARHRRQYAPAARWLPAVFAAGVAAELLLGLIYSQAF